jgi:hypothetical protein
MLDQVLIDNRDGGSTIVKSVNVRKTGMRRFASALLAAAMLLLLNAAPSFAASSSHTTPAASSPPKVYLVQAVQAGSSATPQVRVFGTRAEAVAAVPQYSSILATLYDNSPPGGDSIVIYGTTCDNSFTSDLGSMDNRTSSLDDGCAGITLYSMQNEDGLGITYPNGRCNYVGDEMNNQAESVRFTISPPGTQC